MKEQFTKKIETNEFGYRGGQRFFEPDGAPREATFNPLFDKLSKIEKEKERDARIKKDLRAYENKASYKLEGATPIGVLRRKITEEVPRSERAKVSTSSEFVESSKEEIATPEKVKENLPEVETEEKPVPEKNKKLTSKDVADTFYKGGDISEREQKFYKKNKDRVNKIIREKIKEDPEVQESFDKAKEEVSKNLQDFFEENRVKDNRVISALDKMNTSEREILYIAPDFFTLNGNQQIYILEKIRQKIAGDATILSEEKVEENLKRKTKFFSKDFFKKKWQAFTKENEESKERKNILEKIRETGIRGYEDDMLSMTNHVKNLESDISYDKDGKLVIEYVKKDTFVWDSEYVKRFRKDESPDDYIDRLNKAASALSEVPYEWSMPSASIIEKMKYKKALAEYNKHKSIIFGAVAENDKIANENEKEATMQTMLWANSLDSRIRMNQLLTTHPDLEKYGSGGFSFNGDHLNPDNTKWGLAKMGFLTGVGARMVSRKTFEAVEATVAAAVIGGLLAGRKKWVEFSEKEKKKRRGEAVDDRGIKKYINAGESAKRIEYFIEKIEKTDDPRKKEIFLKRLQNHFYVIDERVRNGRVNFESSSVEMSERLALNQAMAEAGTVLFLNKAKNDSEDMEELLSRFNRFQKDGEKAWEKRKDVGKAALVGAIKSGTFAAVGFLVADYFSEIGSGQSLEDRYKELLNEGGDGAWNDVPQEPVVSSTPEIKPVDAIDQDKVLPNDPAPKIQENPVASQEAVHEPSEPRKISEVERPKVPEKLSPEEDFIKRMKSNIREIKNHDGDLKRLEIKHLSFIEDVEKFRKNAGEFLIDDMSKSGLPENMQTRSWGIKQIISVKGSVEQFLGFKSALKVYPEGSPEHELIEKELFRLGENIRSNVGNIFKPYEEMAPSLIETPEVIEVPEVENVAPEIETPPQENILEKDNVEVVEGVANNEVPDDDVVSTENVMSVPETPETIETSQTPEVPETAPQEISQEVAPEAPQDASQEIVQENSPEISAKETTPEIKINEEIVSKSFDEEGNLDLDFHDKNIEGKLKFIKGQEDEMIVEESYDFHTSYGKEFRSNPQKFISEEDIEKMVKSWSEEKPGANINARKILDRFEDFINKREALRLSGIPIDSKEALTLKGDMARIDVLFERHTGISVLDRLKLIESGVEIEPSPEHIVTSHPDLIETPGPDIDIKSNVISRAVNEYGEGEFEGNVVFFEKGYVGFYKESLDLATAEKMALAAAKVNENLLIKDMGPVNQYAARLSDGTYRFLVVYKQKE